MPPKPSAAERDRRGRRAGRRGSRRRFVIHFTPMKSAMSAIGRMIREERAPVQRLEHGTGDGGSDRRGERDDQADAAHHPTSGLRRNDVHDRRHQQRHHDAGTGGLDDAPHEQDRETGSDQRDERAERERDHRGDEDLPRGEALQDETGGRDHDGHRQHEGTGEPLAELGRDAEIGVQMRDRDPHRGLVEDGDERGDEQQPDHAHVLARDLTRCRCGGRRDGAGIDGRHGRPPGRRRNGDIARVRKSPSA